MAVRELRLHSVVTLGLATALILLAIPQAIDSTIRLYAAGDEADSQIGSAIARLESADTWWDDPEAEIRAGMLAFSIASGPTARENLDHAINDLSDGLARAPGNARGWSNLAQALLSEGDARRAALAFQTSVLVAPYEPSLSVWRCQIGFSLWGALDDDGRRLLREQVRYASDTDLAGLVTLARRDRASLGIVRSALIEDSSRLAKFEAAFGQR